MNETCNNNDDDCNGTPDDIAPEPCQLSTDGIATTCPGLCTRRGEVDPGPAPGEVARVGKVWRFAMTPSQTGWMPGDAFDFTLEAGPVTMAIDPATGEIAWTPAPEDQTWNADPTLSTRTTVTVRATALDGQFAEHTVELQVLPAVFVTGVHPAAGLSTGGEPLLGFGAGFVEPDGITGSIGVDFGHIPANAVTIVDESTLAVTSAPAPALTRPLVIVLDGDPEVELRPGFTHLPVLDFASAAAVPIGSNLVVTGSGWDPAFLASNQVSFASRGASTQLVMPSASPVGAEATVSLGIGQFQPTFATGPVHLVINGLRSNAIALRITDSPATPHLTVVESPAAASVGGTVTLRGAGFSGLAATDLDVHFLTGPGPTDRARGTVTAINAAGTELSVTVPSGARTGPVTLSAPGRHTTTSHVPVVVSGTEPVPFIFDATPEILAPGEVLVIRGQGFSEGRVTIGGLEARVLSEEPHRLVVEVPDAAFGPGAIAVEMADLTIAGPTLGISGRVFERIAGGAPTPERVIGPDAESYGRFPSGRVGDLRANGVIDMHALPNGDLLLLPQNGHLVYHVKADADGHIDADSPFVVVLGTGPGGGGSLAGRRPVSAQSLTTSAIERDDVGLIISLSGTAAVRLHVDF